MYIITKRYIPAHPGHERVNLKTENRPYLFSIFMLSLLIFVCFFLPWFTIESGKVGMISKLLTGKNQAVIERVSGFRIPILANGVEARLMISVIKMFSPRMRNAARGSFYVWVLPLLGVMIYGANSFFSKTMFVNILTAVCALAVYILGMYKIYTTDLNRLMLRVSIEPAMWLTFYSYAAIFVAAFLHILWLRHKKRLEVKD